MEYSTVWHLFSSIPQDQKTWTNIIRTKAKGNGGHFRSRESGFCWCILGTKIKDKKDETNKGKAEFVFMHSQEATAEQQRCFLFRGVGEKKDIYFISSWLSADKKREEAGRQKYRSSLKQWTESMLYYYLNVRRRRKPEREEEEEEGGSFGLEDISQQQWLNMLCKLRLWMVSLGTTRTACIAYILV